MWVYILQFWIVRYTNIYFFLLEGGGGGVRIVRCKLRVYCYISQFSLNAEKKSQNCETETCNYKFKTHACKEKVRIVRLKYFFICYSMVETSFRNIALTLFGHLEVFDANLIAVWDFIGISSVKDSYWDEWVDHLKRDISEKIFQLILTTSNDIKSLKQNP